MKNVKFSTEVLKLLAFVTLAIITSYGLWNTKITEYVFKGI